ncbi:cytidine deaminase-like protein [Patellaria atrata CBS 101060]|uniref:Cytidine deaminase-like protein n=1 Tax=Patellaria atrata CBS 101060 TaxID=1346257 RepID=A0A9P4VR28_9PEZI|nr:cytidine deaminase-like protein [Patellaria atrata CBS 101060]
MQSSAPVGGFLTPLKTKAEVRASNETIDVYIVEIPAKSASALLNLLKDAIPNQHTVDLQHLRRFAKQDFLPSHLRSIFEAQKSAEETSTSSTLLGEQSRERFSPPAPSANPRDPTLILLITPTSLIQESSLLDVLSKNTPFATSLFPLKLMAIPVPALAPTSALQAEVWSRTYWPTVYKSSNPFGPHPSVVSRAQAQIQPHAARYLGIARRVGAEAKDKGYGEPFGCVIVQRLEAGTERIVAVAGDARYVDQNGEAAQSASRNGTGNVMAHVVLRAIGIVARKRLRLAESTEPHDHAQNINYPFLDIPLLSSENPPFVDLENLTPNGYLCVDLEIYVSHEPCVMCSMAILHSRFSRCIFGTRMPRTGAMTADGEGGGLGYGLFWRPSELNWKMLCWAWREENANEESEGHGDGGNRVNV